MTRLGGTAGLEERKGLENYHFLSTCHLPGRSFNFQNARGVQHISSIILVMKLKF